MFNLGNENAKDKVEDLANKSENLVKDASRAVKSKTSEIGEAVVEKTDEAKYEANHLISSLRDLINEYSDSSKINRLRGQISDTASELKTAVSNGVSNAYYTGKQKTSDTIQENPLGTLALVAGASLVVGYLFGTKKSDK